MFYQYNHSGITQYYCKEYGKNFNFPVHLHQSYELITVLAGEMSVTVNSREYKIKRGEGVLVFPNQLHSLESETCEHMLCIFSGELVKAYSTKISGKRPECNKFLLPESLVAAIDRLHDEGSVLEKKGVLYLACAEFDKTAEYREKSEMDFELLDKIFSFVEKNFAGDCSLKRLGQEKGYSYSYISRYFKRVTGITINTYINQYRISNACYMLSNTNATVLECAMESGYESLRSFNRNFMAHIGKTPTEYRKINKKQSR